MRVVPVVKVLKHACVAVTPVLTAVSVVFRIFFCFLFFSQMAVILACMIKRACPLSSHFMACSETSQQR